MFKQLLQSILSFLFLFSFHTSTICQTSYEVVHIYTDHDGLSSNYITSITKYNIGLLLIGTHNGVHIYDGYNFNLTNSTSPPPLTLNAEKVNSFEIGNNGYSWIGSINGINKINPFNGVNKLYFNQGNLEYPPLKSDTISNTLLASSPNGKMWIVNNGIICQIINEEVKQYFPERFNSITKILSDNKNNLYALSNQSLISLNASGRLLFELKEFTSPLFGLQEISKMSNLFKTKKNEIIIEDHLNDRYFKIDSLGKIEDLTTENHWLPSFFKELDLQVKTNYIKDLRKFDFEKTEDGLIWVATNIGLIKVEITSSVEEHAPIEHPHFVFLYKKYDFSTGKLKSIFLNPNNVKPIYLNPKELFLVIQFINSNFSSPLKNTFSHYLEGFDKNWLPYNTINSVNYSNLPEGEYLFKLKSKNSNGVENDFVFEIPIIVKKSIDRIIWFKGIALASVLLSLTFFLRYKHIHKHKIGLLRNRMASDLHDEVSNSLNNIRIIAKESNISNQGDTTSDFLRIQKISNQAIEHVEDVIWSLDENYSEAENLYFKMEDYLDDVLRAKNIPVKHTWKGLNKRARLEFIYRRNLLLIFKEAISNIIKHTKPLEVRILFTKTTERYVMKIRNSFEERITAENSTGKGIKGMRQRAESMGASIEFIEDKNSFEVLMKKKFKQK